MLLSVAVRAETPDYFVLRVQDKATSEPIGCTTLTTTGRVVYTSDENGLVAFFEPGRIRFRDDATDDERETVKQAVAEWLATEA